jgi:hypothetical protein
MEVDLGAVLDATVVADVGVPASAELLALANAVHLDPAETPAAAQRLEAVVGTDGVVEAAATIAVFNGLVRVADGTGIQLDAGVLADSADFRAKAGIDQFAGAGNTRTTPVAVDRSSVTDLFA